MTAGTTDLEAELAALAEPAPPALADRVAAEVGLIDLYLTVDGPVAPLLVAFNRRSGVTFVDAAAGDPGLDETRFRRAFAARYPRRTLRRAPDGTAPPIGLRTILDSDDGRAKTPTSVRCDLSSCSPFQQAVLNKAAEIPRGEVRSYGWIAREIGHDGATRAVGTALGRNPVPVLIPCHRVVRTDGRIGNYALGSAMKTQLLEREGVDLDELARLAQAGQRFVGSATTLVFCVPTCHQARRIRPHNRVLFRTAPQATAKGYRPCKTCRPVGPVSTT